MGPDAMIYGLAVFQQEGGHGAPSAPDANLEKGPNDTAQAGIDVCTVCN